jgi:hypothetical protein
VTVEKNKTEKLAKVFHCDLYGKRQEKYNFLLENDLQSIDWNELQSDTPDYFFVPKDFSLQEEYEKGFKIDELFKSSSQGIVPSNKHFTIQTNENNLMDSIKDFLTLDTNKAIEKYKLKESRDWKVTFAKKT